MYMADGQYIFRFPVYRYMYCRSFIVISQRPHFIDIATRALIRRQLISATRVWGLRQQRKHKWMPEKFPRLFTGVRLVKTNISFITRLAFASLHFLSIYSFTGVHQPELLSFKPVVIRKVDTKAMIRNRYNRIPHPALNTTGKEHLQLRRH